jgi:hypothetical protein
MPKKLYRFYVYQDTWSAGGDNEKPDELVVATADPRATATAMCKGNVTRVDWDEIDGEAGDGAGKGGG